LNDDVPGPPPGPLTSGFVADLAMGLRFYSRIPVPWPRHELPQLDRMAPALPFVSLLIGLPPALLLAVLTFIGLPSTFAAGLALAALLIITGAMAEDGLADAADGLFGGATVARRLEIMRDSRHGTYGVLALALLIVLRVVALGTAAALHPIGAIGLWLGAMVIARSGSLWLPVSLPPARADGLSAAMGGLRRTSFAVGGAIAAAIAAVLALPLAGLPGVIAALLLVVAAVLGWTALCQRLVGGQTGDLIGALQALLELAALTAFLIAA
jgi:adenosylcobinamide-GDP ribazoletransferase